MKILITGGNGMLGRALREREFFKRAFIPSRDECDCCDEDSINYYMKKILSGIGIEKSYLPDTVIHCAGLVGGVKDNSERPYDYFMQNAKMALNIVQWCVENNVEHFVGISSTCVYDPTLKYSDAGIREENLHKGPPDESNFGYAYAKRALQVAVDAARVQKNFKACVLYPTNMYGRWDKFDPVQSHFVPAAIRKFHEQDPVEFWGDPKVKRQFLLVDDFAEIIELVVRDRICRDMNVAPEDEITVGEFVGVLQQVTDACKAVSFNGENMGVDSKKVSTNRFREIFPDFVFTELEDGLRQVWDWYCETYKKDKACLRL